MSLAAHNIRQTAEHHRKQAEAYEALSVLLRRVELNKEPAPVREIAEALRPMGLCLVPRDMLAIAIEVIEPGDNDDEPSTQLIATTAAALRDILHPELTQKNPTKELPL